MSFWNCSRCLDYMKSREYSRKKAQCELVVDHVVLLEEIGEIHERDHK